MLQFLKIGIVPSVKHNIHLLTVIIISFERFNREIADF